MTAIIDIILTSLGLYCQTTGSPWKCKTIKWTLMLVWWRGVLVCVLCCAGGAVMAEAAVTGWGSDSPLWLLPRLRAFCCINVYRSLYSGHSHWLLQVHLIAGNYQVMHSFTDTHCDALLSINFSFYIHRFVHCFLRQMNGLITVFCKLSSNIIALPHNWGIMQLNLGG